MFLLELLIKVILNLDFLIPVVFVLFAVILIGSGFYDPQQPQE